MPDSIDGGALATFAIKIDGKSISDDWAILSVHVEKKINKIASASFVILDGRTDTGKFEASSSDVFLPGKAVSIEAGYDSKNAVVFKGIITRQSIRIDEFVGSSLEIECRDVAIKTTVGRKSQTYPKQKDSDIISKIVGNYPGLSVTVTATTTSWPQQVQHYVTDWDYILSRAEINGLLVATINGEMKIFKPDASTTSVLQVKYGDGLLEFNADLNSVNQFETVNASTWDFKTQKVVSSASKCDVTGPGNLSSKKLAEVVGLANYNLQTTAPFEKADLENWSKAQLVKSEYAKIRGEAKVQGTALAELGNYITLAGLGDRFNGDHLVSGIRHDIAEGNWTTEISIGLSPLWFVEEADVMAPTASNLLAGACGLFNATVKKMYEDPDSQFRILVDVPLIDNQGQGIWARLSNFYSTSGAGAFFLPEVGDEVIVGFLNEDPRYPIILGSLYSNSKIKPFEGLAPNEKNTKKAIVSKSGIYIQFDDDKKIFTISTPDKNKIILDDDKKKITIEDDNGNMVTMSDGGIFMKSPKDIMLQADGKVTITGKQGVKLASDAGDAEISGINVSQTAMKEFMVDGGMKATVQSSMNMTLESAMININ